jgi:two-component system, LuxR family, sensor kinase FixL
MTTPAASEEPALRSLLEASPDAIIIIDDRGIVQSVNGIAEALFGLSAQDIIGRNVSMLMPPPYREAHDAYIERYLRTGQRRIIGIGRVVVGLRADGSVFPMELYVGELYSGGRRLFSGFVRDLTAVRRVERRLQDLQSEFQQSLRIGSMARMMSSLAHELNQPMSALLSYSEAAQAMLAGGGADAVRRASEPLGKAIAQAQRASAVIRRMRDFVSHAAPPRRPEDINTVVIEASALALSGTNQADMRVHAELDESLPMVLIDKAAVQEALYHLMSNAVQAMRGRPASELIIETSANAERSQVSVAVSDTGPGLSAENREQLYRPFMGAEEGRHGVGLAISREIVESHGGRLVAEDRPGGGARFWFSLPVVAQDVG